MTFKRRITVELSYEVEAEQEIAFPEIHKQLSAFPLLGERVGCHDDWGSYRIKPCFGSHPVAEKEGERQP